MEPLPLRNIKGTTNAEKIASVDALFDEMQTEWRVFQGRMNRRLEVLESMLDEWQAFKAHFDIQIKTRTRTEVTADERILPQGTAITERP